ncbi:hypothetical protein BT96DRAFT_921269, partial [Gymnopus androsaceus JB14]
HESRIWFQRLANELLLLIGDEISEDPRTLKALALVSKRCNDFFNPFLTHPASFVKKLSVSPTPGGSATGFRKQMASAMKNIALYAIHGAIQSFTFRSNFSLPEAFGSSVPPALRHLEELILICPIPAMNAQSSLSLANSLCRRSLIVLDLDFRYPLESLHK